MFTRDESTEKVTDAVIKYLSSAYENDQQIFKGFIEGTRKLNGRLFYNLNVNNVVISGGCHLYLMPTLPDDLKDFKDSYILVNEQLYYIHNGTSEKIIIKDFNQFRAELNILSNNTVEQPIPLTDKQVQELITLNGGHTPSGSAVLEKIKLCEPLLKEYHDQIAQLSPVLSEWSILAAHNIREAIIHTFLTTENWERFWGKIISDISPDMQQPLEMFFASAICFIMNKAISETIERRSLHLMQALPEDLKNFKDSYVLVKKQLYYINHNETSEKVSIEDFNQFKNKLNSLMEQSIQLTDDQVKDLITSNGRHIPLAIPLETNKLVSAIFANSPDANACLDNLREQYSEQLSTGHFSTELIFNNIDKNLKTPLEKLMTHIENDLSDLPKNSTFSLLGEYAISATLDRFHVFLQEILDHEMPHKHDKLKKFALEIACDSALTFINSQKKIIYGKNKSHENTGNTKLRDEAMPVLKIALEHASNKAKKHCPCPKADIKNWKPADEVEIEKEAPQRLTAANKSPSSLLKLFSRNKSSSIASTENNMEPGIEEAPQRLTEAGKSQSSFSKFFSRQRSSSIPPAAAAAAPQQPLEDNTKSESFLKRTTSRLFKKNDMQPVQRSVSQPRIQPPSPPPSPPVARR